MKIKNYMLKNKTLLTVRGGNIQFDNNGFAEVPDDIAEELLSLRGYTAADESEVVKTEKKPEPVKEVPVEEEKPQETANTQPEDEGEATEESLADTLDAMNVPQLKKYAKDNDIDLAGAQKKDEIIAVILGSN